MDTDLNEKIDSAIARLAEQVKVQVDPNKALHFSQSALNLAQTKLVLQGSKSDSALALSAKKN